MDANSSWFPKLNVFGVRLSDARFKFGCLMWVSDSAPQGEALCFEFPPDWGWLHQEWGLQ